MNILRAMLAVFTEPKMEDMVAHYALSCLQTEDAILLVTDAAMQPVYSHLATKLRCTYTGDLLTVESDLEAITQKEVIVAHSTFDTCLFKRIAMRASHMIVVVEYFDTIRGFAGQLDEMEVEFGCKIDFAFIEEGIGERIPYSQTESHYLGHRIRRMAKQVLQ